MKYILVAIFLLSTGCAKVTFKDDEMSYSRFGSQKLEGVEFEKKADGTVKVKFSKQEGDAGVLGEALKNTSEAALNMSKSLIVPVH